MSLYQVCGNLWRLLGILWSHLHSGQGDCPGASDCHGTISCRFIAGLVPDSMELVRVQLSLFCVRRGLQGIPLEICTPRREAILYPRDWNPPGQQCFELFFGPIVQHGTLGCHQETTHRLVECQSWSCNDCGDCEETSPHAAVYLGCGCGGRTDDWIR